MIKTLLLHNFRNYEKQAFTFGSQINLICGANGQGKTNLLEALSLVTTGRSFRTTNLLDIIQDKKDYFCLEATATIDETETSISLYMDRREKKLKIDSTYYKTFTPLIGLIPSIFHTPKDMEMITGSPSFRRKFLDLFLSQQDKHYFHHLIRYYRAKKQRDHLLKQKSSSAIECFENEMAKSGLYLVDKRTNLIDKLKDPFLTFGKNLSPDQDIPSISYIPSCNPISLDEYLNHLHKSREKEFHLGYTLSGPHRDDFMFSLNDKSTKTFASEGEKRSSITALRFAQWTLASEHKKALIAIDDITTHLDPFRQNSLKNLIDGLSQAFITTPTADTKWDNIDKVFVIEKGQLKDKSISY